MRNDYLGAGRQINGSIIIDLLESDHLEGDGTADDKLKGLWLEFRAWCRENRVGCPPGRFTKVGLNRESGKQYPEMPSVFKACQMKLISAFLAYKSRVVCDALERRAADPEQPPVPGDLLRRAKVRATCSWGLANAEYLMDCGRLLLPREHAIDLKRSIYTFLRALQWLSHDSQVRGTYMYYIKPKCHYIEHTAMDLSETLPWSLNPRYVSCMCDETFMGKLLKIGKRTHSVTASLRVLQRYLLYIALRWEKRRRQKTWCI